MAPKKKDESYDDDTNATLDNLLDAWPFTRSVLAFLLYLRAGRGGEPRIDDCYSEADIFLKRFHDDFLQSRSLPPSERPN